MNKTKQTNEEAKPPSSRPNNNHKDLVVYLYNVVEDEWSFINSLSNSVEISQEIERDEATSDCFFLAAATGSEFVYISPKPIAPEFSAYAENLLNYKNGAVLVPKSKTHQLCLDLINDKPSFNQLLQISQPYSRITLISYAASPQFYELKHALLNAGANVYTPEAPKLDSAWTVNFFGSKSGIRQLAQKSVVAEPDFIMPDGVICVGKFDAAKIAANKYIKNKGVVIKTNKGQGGSGVLIFRENELSSDYTACEQQITQYLSQQPYWDKFPIIVEDLITVNMDSPICFPNVEFKIKKNGAIDMFYFCTMKVTPEGKFYGLDINDDILNDRLATRIIDTGYYIAEQYSSAGYRGHFDVDFMLAKNGQIFVSESNTRNTGGTDVAKISQKLIGKDFVEDAYTLTRSHFTLKKNQHCIFEPLLTILQPILYDPSKKQGVIINSENILKSKELLYTIIAPSKKTAFDLENQLFSLLD